MNIYPGYRPTARTSEEVQETPKNMQPTTDGVPVWSKAMLITFWVFQLIICIIGWGIGALALGTKRLLDDGDYTYSHGVKLALSVGGGVWVAWASATFILIVTEIIMFSRQNLKAWFEVTSCCVKTTLWLVMFLISVHDTAVTSSGGLSLLILGVFL
ncbi:unnamed protein product [Aureobasidium mustum]|uniref:Uncharacterized protein n=1 Tax=Aureobasidium mustum TaxID=2773714 RepID=A0A9N8JS97_9PEZI|nr:unnamed protein product [Aureobasidium mustum]